MERAGLIAGKDNIFATRTQLREAPRAADFPDWIVDCLSTLRAKFAAGSIPWDRIEDPRDYGRQFAMLKPEQAAQVISLLRDRYTFRPSVAEVRSVVLEVLESSGKQTGLMASHTLESYRRVRVPSQLALPSSGECAGRQTFRDTMKRIHAKQKRMASYQIMVSAFMLCLVAACESGEFTEAVSGEAAE